MERKENMPSWVYWGLWGINSRKVAMGFFVVTAILAFVIVPAGILIKDYLLVAFFLVPVWYWQSIKWADANSAWVGQGNS